jgi:hypothetical protein
MAANPVFCRRIPDFNLNEHVFAKCTHGWVKTTRETLTGRGDTLARRRLFHPENAPTTSKMANTLQPETITLGS